MVTSATEPTTTRPPLVVRLTKRLESWNSLDQAVRLARPVADALNASERRRDALQGMWIGHGIHPLLTDFPLGMWMSTSLLDLLGGRPAQPAARLLLGLGIVSTVPTAVTGLSEWGGTGGRESRVGVVHAAANSTALLMYVASWVVRGRGRHGTGTALALMGGTAATVGGYLGGHLTEVRKVSSRHPAFLEGEALSGPPSDAASTPA